MRANPGDIVQLREFEDQPRQVGVVLSRSQTAPDHPWMYVVQLRPEDRVELLDRVDDGLRELEEDQIEEVLWRDPENDDQTVRGILIVWDYPLAGVPSYRAYGPGAEHEIYRAQRRASSLDPNLSVAMAPLRPLDRIEEEGRLRRT